MGEERSLFNSEWDEEPVMGFQDRNYVIVLIIRICIIRKNLHGFVVLELFTLDFIAFNCFLHLTDLNHLF